MLRLRAFAVFVFLFAFGYSAIAQTSPATGLYPWGSFDNRGFDTINIGNLNTHFEIPIISKSGRGQRFDYRIVYEGLLWSPSLTSTGTTWVPDAEFGFRGQLNGGTIGYVTLSALTVNCPRPPNTSGPYPPGATLTNWVYHDPYGVNHRFNLSIKECPLTDEDGGTITGNGSTNDGSGYSFGGPKISQGVVDSFVYDRQGRKINAPQFQAMGGGQPVIGGGFQPGSITDPNGNVISNNGDGTFTDTLGVTALTIGGSGNASSPRTFAYKVAQQSDASTTATASMSYVTRTVATHFQCANIGEYGPQSVDLIDRITLADGTFYQFTYENTPGVAGAVTGRLASVTLPTGGTISYQYTAGCNGSGINSDGSVATLTRTADGPRTYNHSVASATASSTTIQDEIGNQSSYQFTIFNGLSYETRRQIYQGQASGTPLLDRQTCYNNTALPSCASTALTAAISQVDTYETLDGVQQHGSTTKYNTSGALTEQDDYDFGNASSRGALLRKDIKTYAAAGNALVLTQDEISDGSGSVLGRTTYGYDETSGTGHAALQPTSNLPQHSAISGARGNVTTVSQWINTTNTYVNTAYSYDDAGQRLTGRDARGNTTTFTYDSADAFPKDVTYPTPGSGVTIKTSTSYDQASGVLLSSSDPNNQVTTYRYYDRLLRPIEIDYPGGGQTNYSYPSATETDTTVLATPDPSISSQDIKDSFGRPYQHIQAGVSTEVSYDAAGRISCVTNPHFSTGSSTDGTACITVYDGLDRPKTQTQQDGSTLTWSYSGNTVTSTDEAGHSWQRTIDALGRLTKVIEPGNLTTNYQYSGFATQINQLGASGDTPRPTRSFVYDSLSRLVSVTEPESGTTTYSYDNNGNVITRVAPAPNAASGSSQTITTSFTYDALNRLTLKQAPGISYFYRYDLQQAGSIATSSNGIGRLVFTTNNVNADRYFGYDAMGRLILAQGCSPSDCSSSSATSNRVSSIYDSAGHMTDLTYPDGRHIKQSWDAAGRLASVSYADWNGQAVNYPYAIGFQYSNSGQLSQLTLGNGIVAGMSYNNRLQPCRVFANSTTVNGGVALDTHYHYSSNGESCAPASGNNGNIVLVEDALYSGKTWQLSYDLLNRLASAGRLDGMFYYNYPADSFGNVQQMNNLAGNPTVAFSTNNQMQVGGNAYTYDAAGNLISTGALYGQTYSYNSDGLLEASQVNGTQSGSYTYNPLEQRVRKDVEGDWTEYVYFGEQLVAQKHSDNSWSDFISANGQTIARADSYDVRLHFTGNNCSGCGQQTTAYYIPINHYTILPGDRIAWRQFQYGPAVPRGGLSLQFSDGTYTNWQTVDLDGQIMNSDTTQNAWHYRVADLSQYAGKTINTAWITNDADSGAGYWEEWFSDIAFFRKDGTVQSIYNRADSVSYSSFGTSGVTGRTFEVNRANTTDAALLPRDTTRYYVEDQIGSARMEFAGGGWPVWKGDFAPYGQEIDPQQTMNPYRFASLERDGESGLDHATFRQYSSTMGRWLSPDPYTGSYDFTNPQSFNRYSYVGNRPLSFADPLGLIMGGSETFDCADPIDFDCGGGFGGIAVGGGAAGGGAGGDGTPVNAGDPFTITGPGAIAITGFPIELISSPAWGPYSFLQGHGGGTGIAPNNNKPPKTAFSGSLSFPIAPGITGSVPVAITNNAACVGLGAGFGSPGWGVNGGIVHTTANNIVDVLEGASVSFAAQSGFLGVQWSHNNSGIAVGNSIGTPGISLTVSYSVCF